MVTSVRPTVKYVLFQWKSSMEIPQFAKYPDPSLEARIAVSPTKDEIEVSPFHFHCHYYRYPPNTSMIAIAGPHSRQSSFNREETPAV